KAALAYLPNTFVARLLDTITYTQFTPHTITNRMDFLADLEKTKTRGWSLNQEEFTRGIVSVGAPIFSGDHGVAGAICVDIPTIRIENERFLKQVAQKVVHTAQEISDIGSYHHLE
ncbi:MAG: IclR family transcriptional regulator, partial [candidate division Zixibacteria bacterium]|nr:IclR family transcriptional regulator [candidate division Zixibacteria bacterium]